VNFVADVGDSAPARRRALIELTATGSRREWSFGEVSARAGSVAGTVSLNDVCRADVVMILVSARAEWLRAMLATLRLGAIALPSNPQLWGKDLAVRMAAAALAAVVVDDPSD
jgi:acetyl-CoA synthetase